MLIEILFKQEKVKLFRLEHFHIIYMFLFTQELWRDSKRLRRLLLGKRLLSFVSLVFYPFRFGSIPFGFVRLHESRTESSSPNGKTVRVVQSSEHG